MSQETLQNKQFQGSATENEEEGRSWFDLQAIIKIVILYWYWYVTAILAALVCAFLYARYTSPVYKATAKMLIKVDDQSGYTKGRQAGLSGFVNTVNQMGNEFEILKSNGLAKDVVTDLRLYITYTSEGRIQDKLLYKQNPISVDLDPMCLDDLPAPIEMRITRKKNVYYVTGSYYVSLSDGSMEGPIALRGKFDALPNRIVTKAGVLTFNASPYGTMKNGEVVNVSIAPPAQVAGKFASSLSPDGKDQTSMVVLTLRDENLQRAKDYLSQLVVCYNRQANEDKNLIALRTEEFINARIEKFVHELGTTESAIEDFKKRNHMVELKTDATQAASNARQTEQRLAEMEVQLMFLKSMTDFINNPSNQYQLLPTNYGLSDPTSSGIITQYNQIVLERNRLMRSAGENNPALQPLTIQLDNLLVGLRSALAQARRTFEMQRGVVQGQLGTYYNRIAQSPEQERFLSEVGRQHDLKNSIYQTLLQRREENSISLAATADKAKLLDEPVAAGIIGTPTSTVFLIALIISLMIPSTYFFVKYLLRYKIEGHEDVERLTKLPILTDVPIASETAKTKADIVVHENKNNQMEEVFRSMRTNLNFLLKDGQKVILFTSTTSGEGKTFNAANLAVSYALLDKKVIIVGLDIRKPRLARLFEIKDKRGISTLLPHDNLTRDQIFEQILPSGVHPNLDLLLAGPVPPNPAELVARDSLDRIIDRLRKEYDYIIIDSAPVGLVTDTFSIGRVADATVYMCRADFTPKQSFYLLNELAEQDKLHGLCVVVNGIDMSKKKYGYYYGYGKYGKYSKYGSYYGRYGRYGRYGKTGRYGYYGSYGTYGHYGYGHYRQSNYGNKKDDSIKL